MAGAAQAAEHGGTFLTLRAKLYGLLVAVAVPLVALAVAFGAFLVQQKRETARQEATGRILAIVTAIDTAIASSESALRTLASSSSLAGGDIKAFHEESRRFLATQPQLSNISLASAEGENLAEAVWPFGTRARVYTDLPSFYAAAKEGVTTYGNVAVGPAIGIAAVRVRVPVVINGAVHYVVSAPHRLEWFESLLREQQPPSEWTIALLDANKQFIARVPPSQPSSASLQAALQGVTPGSLNARTLDSKPVYATAVGSPRTGWAVAVALPQQVIDGPALRVLIVVLACGAVVLVITVIVGLKFAARLTADYRRVP